MRRHGGAPVSYLEPTVPVTTCEMAVVIRSAGCAFCLLFSSTTVLLFCNFLRATAVARKKVIGDELDVRAKSNGYRRVHTEEDSRQDRNKHIDMVKGSGCSVGSLRPVTELYLHLKTIDTEVEFQLALRRDEGGCSPARTSCS